VNIVTALGVLIDCHLVNRSIPVITHVESWRASGQNYSSDSRKSLTL